LNLVGGMLEWKTK